ncbi:MAG: hypothetical protein KAS58_06470, partial [Calditrichia bacterium]|nr:hypothetical protein [Calditrichia bacterium]
MTYEKRNLIPLIQQLEEITRTATELENQYGDYITNIHPKYKKSASNMIHYLALRHRDITQMQKKLGDLGITRLGKAESHVMASIFNALNILKRLIGLRIPVKTQSHLSIQQGIQLIRTHTTALLGKKLIGSKVRIMVTLPTEAAENKKMIRN